jgi:dTDP-4-dehydrorhamnose reductase
MENTLENAKACMLKTNRSNQDITNIEMMVAYAASVRPDVVVPSEKIHNEYIDDNSEWAEKNGWNACLSELRRLNQTLTFTENHEK